MDKSDFGQPLRTTIVIDEKKCNGCGNCATACTEGVIEIIGGVAKLVDESHCDGLGACIGECPTGAITIVTTDTQKVCPIWNTSLSKVEPDATAAAGRRRKDLASNRAVPNWPIKIPLVPADAKWLEGANLVISADCVAYACPDFHEEYIGKDRALMVCCPKFSAIASSISKLAEIFQRCDIYSVEVLYMNVACCSGLVSLVQQAQSVADTAVPVRAVEIGVDGTALAKWTVQGGL